MNERAKSPQELSKNKKKIIDLWIRSLKKIKKDINADNQQYFNLNCTTQREVKKLMSSFTGLAIGFEQNGPVTTTIVIEDHRNNGKPLGYVGD